MCLLSLVGVVSFSMPACRVSMPAVQIPDGRLSGEGESGEREHGIFGSPRFGSPR